MADEGLRFSGPAIGAIAAGGLLVFAGLKGYSLGTALQDIIMGTSPLSESQVNPITGTPATAAAGGTAGGTATDSEIANQALSYAGKIGYCYGGAMEAAVNGCPAGKPDCSSFVNWVVGHDLQLAIPGYAPGAYDGTVHGPGTISWAVFGSGISRAEVQAGDIVVWGPSVHMGVAISNTEFVSDQDPELAVGTANIDSAGTLGILFCRRIVTPAAPAAGQPQTTTGPEA
jgi:cell wall-associated NlpC family hydrolase